jgi:CubicO group peptidase (beta-lactamase class C family)
MGLGAGDLMMFPDRSNFTKQDIIHNLRYLKQVSPFRSKYDYDNLLYIVAGEVVAKVSGISWEDFIEKRIMQPIGMTSSAASLTRLKDRTNAINPHAKVNGKVEQIDIDWSETANAAGGIWTNLIDFSKWLILQMNNGKYGEGLAKSLFSVQVHNEMWAPQTLLQSNATAPYFTHFNAYGLGFGLSDVKGYKQVTHTGGLAGIVTQETMFPELNLGIIVLTNQEVGAAFVAITNTIKDTYLGVKGMDWVKLMHDRVETGLKAEQKINADIAKDIEDQQKNSTTKQDVSNFLGTYKDQWFGEIVISIKNSKARFDSKRSPKLTGEVLNYKGNTFIVKWDDRSMNADAFLMFSLDKDGKPEGLKMVAISPLTDFSFDFHDLDLKKVK